MPAIRSLILRGARVAVPVAAVLASIALLSGCDLGYLARGAYEEGRLLWNRRPITTELARGDLDADARDRLQLVLSVREFAREQLGLNVGGAYRTVTDVDQNAVAWIVMAAPRDSLQPVTWWFPIVGAVPYRGYFNRGEAIAEAETLEAQGFDTIVRPSPAFSSLGFFDDPLLSNLLKLDRVELAGVIIHELFHRTFFLAGDVMFNESAATFVGSAGAAQYFASAQGAESRDAIAARDVVASDLKFAGFLLQARAQLLKLYMSGLPRDEILKRRVAIFDQIKADYAKLEPQLSGLDRFALDKAPLNNAVLVSYQIYFHDLDNFTALERDHNGNLRATIAAIIEIANSKPEDPFYALWQATHGLQQERPQPTTP